MALKVRRVVTGHDGNGKAVVKTDEEMKHVFTSRPGALAVNVWTTDRSPANNDGDADEGLRQVGMTVKAGTIFRVIEFAPGVQAPSPRRSGKLRTTNTVERLHEEFRRRVKTQGSLPSRGRGHRASQALAAKQATSSIPIVFVLVADAVGAGLITNFARPGGNCTGLTSSSAELGGKRLQLLKQMIPKASRVGVLYNPTDRSNVLMGVGADAGAHPATARGT
jgi:ABC transporter substrate binding protein